jgi:kinesin family protein C2/C3
MATPCAGCAALEEQLTNAELSALEESEKLESDKEALEGEKSALEGELDRLQNQFDTGRARQLQLEQDGTRARERNESTRAELETAAGKLEAALRKLAAVTARERDLEQQNDQLEQTSRILQASTEKLEAELDEAIERETLSSIELEDVRLLSEEIEQRSKDEGKDLALDRRHIEQQLQEEEAAVERLSSELEATRRRCAIAEESLGELQAVAEVAAAAGAVAGEELVHAGGTLSPVTAAATTINGEARTPNATLTALAALSPIAADADGRGESKGNESRGLLSLSPSPVTPVTPGMVYDKERRMRRGTHSSNNSGSCSSSNNNRSNVAVLCRVHPILGFGEENGEGGGEATVEVVGQRELCFNQAPLNHRPGRAVSFTFDHVFDHETTNAQITERVLAYGEITERVLEGNAPVCVFAYGATGSGKTFTMDGTEDDPGVTIRVLEHLVSVAPREGLLECSFCEIYNDVVRDLLVPPSRKRSSINGTSGIGGASGIIAAGRPEGRSRRHSSSGSHRGVRGGGRGEERSAAPEDALLDKLSWHTMTSTADAHEIMFRGRRNRAAAGTSTPTKRSHRVLSIRFQGAGKDGKAVGRLHLVVLAGSERLTSTQAKKPNRLRESAAIQKSLSALGDILQALDQRQRGTHLHRKSTLTRLLRGAMTPRSRVVLVTLLQSTRGQADQTLHSLQYAQRARLIRRHR